MGSLDAFAKWSAIISGWLLWIFAIYRENILIFMAGFIPYLVYVNFVQRLLRK